MTSVESDWDTFFYEAGWSLPLFYGGVQCRYSGTDAPEARSED